MNNAAQNRPSFHHFHHGWKCFEFVTLAPVSFDPTAFSWRAGRLTLYDIVYSLLSESSFPLHFMFLTPDTTRRKDGGFLEKVITAVAVFQFH